MRSNQQNKRSRSRGSSNSNRGKSSNPLSRNYESNGPDVRIRGNAATVAEKYMQLARDAHSSGDSVAAENYLQHAEHYNRIISAAQAQYQQQQQVRADQNGAHDQRSDNDGVEDDEANTPASRFDSPRNDEQDRQNNPPQNNQPQGNRQDNNRQDNNRQENSRQENSRNDGNRQNHGQSASENSGPNDKPEGASETPSTDKGQSADAVAADAGETKPKPARRPRRKRTDGDSTEAKPATNQAGAPQPSVGELPAFVTGNGEVAAE